jgi:ribonuclease HI
LTSTGKKKIYVVWAGRNPGIYNSWSECRAQVSNFPGAKYKSFADEASAREAFENGPTANNSIGKIKKKKDVHPISGHIPVIPSISVDAACSGNPGPVEYRGVITETGQEIFRAGPFEDGTVNIGEFLAIVHALAFLQKENKVLPVYSDSKTALKWIRTGKANTKLVPGKRNGKLFELLARAEAWLAKNDIIPLLLKWDTAAWGEIPADFGRK